LHPARALDDGADAGARRRPAPRLATARPRRAQRMTRCRLPSAAPPANVRGGGPSRQIKNYWPDSRGERRRRAVMDRETATKLGLILRRPRRLCTGAKAHDIVAISRSTGAVTVGCA